MKMMKKKYFLLGSLFILVFSACKKADYPIEDASSYTKVFMQLANNGVIENKMPIEDSWQRFGFGAGCGGVELLSQDIEIGFKVDEEAIAEYNQGNATNYSLAPEGSFRLTEDKVTIPGGATGSNTIYLEVNPFNLQGTKEYLIPVSITSNSANLPITEGLGTTYYLVSGFYESNPFEPYSQANWTIHDYSDDENDGATTGGRAHHAIDGDIVTLWHSQWRKDENGWRPGHPHFIAIDMHETLTLHGIKIYGRVGSKYAYLFPKDVFVETSMDGENWTPAGTYTLTASADDTSATMYFAKNTQAQYFKFTTLSSKGGGATTAVTEIVAF